MNKFIFHLLLLLPLISLTYCEFLKKHGEPCSSDCDESVGLYCNQTSSTCACMNSNGTLHDDKEGRCVSKAGHPCVRFGGKSYCVAHASCHGPNSLCQCEPGYFPSRSGLCRQMSRYGERCGSRKPCDEANGQTCASSSNRSPKICQCKYPHDQYYDEITNKCLSLVNGLCDNESSPCGPNSQCEVHLYEQRQGFDSFGRPFSYNATARKSCSCLPGFTPMNNRRCAATYQENCKVNSDCNSDENLKCMDSSICTCEHPLYQIFDRFISKCVSLVNAPCSVVDFSCTANAECSPRGDEGVCQCRPGFSTTPDGTCLKDEGQFCSGPGECDHFKGLTCNDRKTCMCFDHSLEYSKELNQCIQSKKDMPCGDIQVDGKNTFFRVKCNHRMDCVSLDNEKSHNNNHCEVQSTKKVCK